MLRAAPYSSESARPPEAMPGGGRRVMIHVASRVTEEVFSFLGPATAAMASQGVAQVVVALEDAPTEPWLRRFDPQVQLQRVPTNGRPLRDFARLREATVDVLRRHPVVEGLHLHGLVPCLLGTSIAQALGIDAPVFFSPHGSRLLGPLRLGGRALLWLSRQGGAAAEQRAITSDRADARRLEGLVDSRIRIVESPVLRLFLDVPRSEADSPPIIVAGGHHAGGGEAIAMFTQLIVMLRDTAAEPAFHWLGEVSAEQRAQLSSAKAVIHSRDDEAGRARLLASASIYLAPPGGRGVPVGLTEAMAAGVACIAADTPFHREVIEHGVNGLLYQSPAEMAQLTAALLDSPSARRTLGQAARSEAARRFDDRTFAHRLREAYGQLNMAPAQTPRVADTRGGDGGWRHNDLIAVSRSKEQV